MRAHVVFFHSPDADLATFEPPDATDVGLLVEMVIGPVGGPGEESFDVVVCTPSWLARLVRRDGPLVARHHLVVERFDWALVSQFLTETVAALEAGSWQELAVQIGRIGKWEFEDYRP